MEKITWPRWPEFGDEEIAAVSGVVASQQLFADRQVRLFEEEFSAYLGPRFSVGVGNATQGLHLALAALNVGAGDEVIVTPYSWISSASCVLMQNAVPIFVDIEPGSLGLCPIKVEESISPRTRAIIVVHMFGYPSRIQELQAIAVKYGIPLIEDASHAHGAASHGQNLGTFGSISIFSLHQRKSLPVGDGGIVCTDNKLLAEKVRRLRSFGDSELSYNYRMTEFAAAIGRIRLKRLDKENATRAENANYFAELLEGSSSLSVRLGMESEDVCFYAVLIDVVEPIRHLETKLQELTARGIPIRKTWVPLHVHPHFNPEVPPARGLPWRSADYDGVMKGKSYAELDLPEVGRHCPDRVIELYVNPPAGPREMEFAARHLRKI